MLRYISDNLATINGVEIYPILSLLMFFSFFIVLIWYVIKMDKKDIEEMENFPLNDK